MSDPIEVYTFAYSAFRMSGNPWQPIKTSIEEYETLSMGGPCIVFHNPANDLWHVAVEKCGAIVGTKKTRAAVIEAVRADLASADLAVVAEQIENGIIDRDRAERIPRDRFFSLIKGKAL